MSWMSWRGVQKAVITGRVMQRSHNHDEDGGDDGEGEGGAHRVRPAAPCLLAPKYWQTMMPAPVEMPMNSTSSRFRMGPLAPTAARAASPT